MRPLAAEGDFPGLWLVDNQLPVALARFLASRGQPSVHVMDVGLAEALDRNVWDYAKVRSWVIASKDEDFQDLAIRLGSPPQLLWVRLGNCRKDVLLDVFDHHLPALTAALGAGEPIVELRG